MSPSSKVLPSWAGAGAAARRPRTCLFRGGKRPLNSMVAQAGPVYSLFWLACPPLWVLAVPLARDSIRGVPPHTPRLWNPRRDPAGRQDSSSRPARAAAAAGDGGKTAPHCRRPRMPFSRPAPRWPRTPPAAGGDRDRRPRAPPECCSGASRKGVGARSHWLACGCLVVAAARRGHHRPAVPEHQGRGSR